MCWSRGCGLSSRCWAPISPARSARKVRTLWNQRDCNGLPWPRWTSGSRPTPRVNSPGGESAAMCFRRRRPSSRSPNSSRTGCSFPTGLATYKMVFGHRGINVPVIDHATGRVAVTAQNHGFALEGEAGQSFDTPFGAAVVSHTCANDGVVEGVKLVDGRAFSVQYHPEAAAGPHDAEYLFDSFIELMAGNQ